MLYWPTERPDMDDTVDDVDHCGGGPDFAGADDDVRAGDDPGEAGRRKGVTLPEWPAEPAEKAAYARRCASFPGRCCRQPRVSEPGDSRERFCRHESVLSDMCALSERRH